MERSQPGEQLARVPSLGGAQAHQGLLGQESTRATLHRLLAHEDDHRSLRALSAARRTGESNGPRQSTLLASESSTRSIRSIVSSTFRIAKNVSRLISSDYSCHLEASTPLVLTHSEQSRDGTDNQHADAQGQQTDELALGQ